MREAPPPRPGGTGGPSSGSERLTLAQLTGESRSQKLRVAVSDIV